ncbi:MAG: acyl-CoA dehydrogenase family protein [Flavobacteriales bacterium]|nr:acyl-CoA dehydrogenase family protein [Flavobacteriales bacterium]
MKSKGGDFITKKTNYQSVFVPEQWNEEQIMLKEMIFDFLNKEIHSLDKEHEASKDLPEIVAILENAAQLGLCGIAIEEKFGGSDLDFNTGLLYMEAFAYGFSFATTIGTHVSIGSLPIVYYGNDFQKEKYLPKIATAEIKTAYALTEPSAGSDANSGRTKATLDENRNCYLLNGQKMWISNAGFADLFIVFAKIEQDDKLSAFIVEKEFGGIILGEEEKKLGIKGSSTRQVFFEDCPVPMGNLLGKRNEGFKIALNILNSGRIKLSAAALGGAKFGMRKAVRYANERHQFGKRIGDFTAMQYKIGEMARKIFGAESAIYRTGENIDLKELELKENGVALNEIKVKALRDYTVECSLLKVYGSEVLDYCVDESLQIHGGMGYSVETKVEMGYRDARITRIYEGTNEINRMLSFGELMKKGFQTKEIDTKSISKKIPFEIFKKIIGIRKTTKDKFIENFKYLFFVLSKYATDSFGRALEHEQEIIMNLADILAEIYVLESTYLRIQKLDKEMDNNDEFKMKKNISELQFYESNIKVLASANLILDSLPKRSKILKYLIKIFTPKPEINPIITRRKIAQFFLNNSDFNL